MCAHPPPIFTTVFVSWGCWMKVLQTQGLTQRASVCGRMVQEAGRWCRRPGAWDHWVGRARLRSKRQEGQSQASPAEAACGCVAPDVTVCPPSVRAHVSPFPKDTQSPGIRTHPRPVRPHLNGSHLQ